MDWNGMDPIKKKKQGKDVLPVMYKNIMIQYPFEVIWSDFSHVISKCPLSQNVRFNESLYALLEKGQSVGLNNENYRTLWLLFIQHEYPEFYDTFKVIKSVDDMFMNLAKGLCTEGKERENVVNALKKIKREPGDPIFIPVYTYRTIELIEQKFALDLSMLNIDISHITILQYGKMAAIHFISQLVETKTSEGIFKYMEGSSSDSWKLSDILDIITLLEATPEYSLKSTKYIKRDLLEPEENKCMQKMVSGLTDPQPSSSQVHKRHELQCAALETDVCMGRSQSPRPQSLPKSETQDTTGQHKPETEQGTIKKSYDQCYKPKKSCRSTTHKYPRGQEKQQISGGHKSPPLHDSRQIDELVQFIERDSDTKPEERKKKKLKKKRCGKTRIVANSLDTSQISDHEKRIENCMPKEKLEKTSNKHDSEDSFSKDLDFKREFKTILELEKEICHKENQLENHQALVEELIDTKGSEMKSLLMTISSAEDTINEREKKISENKMQILNLQEQNQTLEEESTMDKNTIEKYETQKSKLESYIEHEMIKLKDDKLLIEESLNVLRKQLSEMQTNVDLEKAKDEKLLMFLDKSISTKERDLECPLCYEVSEPPIFMCPESHLVCANCRPKLEKCPECRIEYRGQARRHRYAEKAAEELMEFKREKMNILSKYDNGC